MATNRFPLNRPIAFAMAMFHIGAIAALFFPSWKLLILFLLTFALYEINVTLCYHRLLTHRSYKTYLWLEYVLTTIAVLTHQGPPRRWVAIHREHHAHTDDLAHDPHTPRESGMWAHLYWMIYPDPRFMDGAPLLIKRSIDLQKHAYYRWLDKFFWTPSVFVGMTCLYFGGVKAVLWGVALPVVVGWHATWLVNSATHMWGSQRFKTGDDSKNNWWVALLTFGEGWHNNHHAAPKSARHGLAWYEIDITYYIIKTLEAVGLVWDVNEAKL